MSWHSVKPFHFLRNARSTALRCVYCGSMAEFYDEPHLNKWVTTNERDNGAPRQAELADLAHAAVAWSLVFTSAWRPWRPSSRPLLLDPREVSAADEVAGDHDRMPAVMSQILAPVVTSSRQPSQQQTGRGVSSLPIVRSFNPLTSAAAAVSGTPLVQKRAAGARCGQLPGTTCLSASITPACPDPQPQPGLNRSAAGLQNPVCTKTIGGFSMLVTPESQATTRGRRC